jgi:hypothetical protein
MATIHLFDISQSGRDILSVCLGILDLSLQVAAARTAEGNFHFCVKSILSRLVKDAQHNHSSTNEQLS